MLLHTIKIIFVSIFFVINSHAIELPVSLQKKMPTKKQRALIVQALKKYGLPSLVAATAVWGSYKYTTDWRHETVIPGMSTEQLQTALIEKISNLDKLKTQSSFGSAGEKAIPAKYELLPIKYNKKELYRKYHPLHPLASFYLEEKQITNKKNPYKYIIPLDKNNLYNPWFQNKDIDDGRKELREILASIISFSKEAQKALLATDGKILTIKEDANIIFHDAETNEKLYTMWPIELQTVRRALQELKQAGYPKKQ